MIDTVFGGSPNPHRPYRFPDRGLLFGVCAGMADYLGWDAWKVRLLTLALCIFFAPQVLLGYAVAAVLLRRRPAHPYRDGEDEAFWRAVSGRPAETLRGLSARLRALDGRVAGMERLVTSREFNLRRDFRDLEGQ